MSESLTTARSERSDRSVSWGRGLLAAALACLGLLALASPSQAEEPWGFEQVTPPVKGEGTVGAVDGFRTAQDGNAFLVLGTLSFLYGVFHAAGPGHGKAVISSYMLANEVALRLRVPTAA